MLQRPWCVDYGTGCQNCGCDLGGAVACRVGWRPGALLLIQNGSTPVPRPDLASSGVRTQDTTDGFALEYERSGSGPPVVLLHGWPGDHTDFAEVVELLDGEGGADLIRPDLRGFGGSDKHPSGDYSAAGQVRSIVGLLDELRIDRAVLCGYDIGSRLAQLVAAHHPDRVGSLVLAPPLPGIGRRVLEPRAVAEFWYQSFHQLDLATELVDGRPDAVRAYLRHFWNQWSGPGFTVSEERLEHLVRRYAPTGAFAASIGWYRSGAAAVNRSLGEEPPGQRIAARTTVLWPEFDPLFPQAWNDRLGEWFSNVTVSVLRGVGHFAPVEAPDAFAEAVREIAGR